MLEGKIGEGKAVVRLKTDMKHPNPAFRDRVLLRIVEREHPRVGRKYKVWPMLEFSWAVDDQLLGITHILRGKDLIIEDMVEEYIWEKLGMKKPHFIHYGLLRLKGIKLSKTFARKAIERGEYTGWDDPRTWSLQALRRRGIQPEAIRKFILKMRLSLADVTVPAEILYAENRKIIDPISNRYLCVLNPVMIKIKNTPPIDKVKMNLHPDFPERGIKETPVDINRIYIEAEDLKKLKGRKVGLINLSTVKLGSEAEFISREISYELPKIHWVSEPHIKIKIMMPDGETKEAIAEPAVGDLKPDTLIQFYRIGFCRVDRVDGETVLYFAHK